MRRHHRSDEETRALIDLLPAIVAVIVAIALIRAGITMLGPQQVSQ